VVFLGTLLPIALLYSPARTLLANLVAAVLVLAGLWIYENLWIKTGQAVPLS
jgi:hypothetical protein